MTNEITKKGEPTTIDDGFAGWTDNVEGSERPQGAGVIQGIKVRFSNDATWLERDDNEMPANLEVVAVAISRYVQRWQDQQPIETIPIASEQPFPDIDSMNEKVPRKEWIDGPDGNPRGPYQACSVVYLVNLDTMDRYSFPAPTVTVGSSIAVRELRDKIMWMRRLRGSATYPVIKLSRVWMNTKWGGRQRPHFEIVRWVRLGGEGGEVEALPPPSSPPTATQAQPDLFAKPTEPSQSELPSVQEPSLQEELNDSIPDFENENAESPKAVAPPLPNPRRNPKKPPAKTGAKKPPPRRPNILDAG